MPRITDVMLIALPEQPIVSIRARSGVDKLPALIGESYGKIAAFLQSKNQMMSDVPFVLYHNMDMQNLDVEMGFPVNEVLPDEGDICSRTLPAGKAAVTMHLGPYTQLEPTYEAIGEWLKRNGFEGGSISMEYYYNSPETSEEHLLTKIVIPIKPA